MEKKYLKLVIVGHVDHGKSTLIGRLMVDTGSMPQAKIDEVKTVCESLGRQFEYCYLIDYMEEEREKNITIDTAQIFFKTEKRDYVIIDAPGHKEFLKNMITGSAQAEAAMLIVDANEGVKEQTKRHAYLLSLLELKQIVVVMNKMDLVDYKEERFNEVKKELLEHLQSINLKPNFIVPISAKDGDNLAIRSQKLNWYKGPTVLEALDSFQETLPSHNLPLRLPIQDVYNFDNQKILAGQVETGVIKAGQEVVFLPSNQKVKVNKVIQWNKELPEASAGFNVGLILERDLNIARGEVACVPSDLPKVVTEFEAKVFWMAEKPFKLNDKFILKCATQETEASIVRMDKIMDSSDLSPISGRLDEIRETEVAEIYLKTAKPIVVEDYNMIPELGRFVIIKDDDIAGGGIVIKI